MKYFLRGLIPDPERRRVLLAIISLLSIYGLTVGFFYPLISLNMELRGYSSSLIGLMGALPFLASIIVSPMIPFIMRFMDVRRWVFVSICSDIFFIFLMIFSENIYIWFVSRFMMGVAGTILFVVSETWINEVAEDHYRGRVMGLYTFVFSATLGISPLFIVVLGAEGNLPFIVALVIIAAGLLPLQWTRGSTPDFSGGKASHVLMFCLLAPTLVGATALMAFEESLVVTLMPVYALRNGLTEASAALILTVAAVGSMAAQPLVGRLADSMNRNLLLFLCALLILVGAILLPFIIQTKIMLWIVMFIWGGAIAAIYTVALTIMGSRFRGAQLAAGNAAFGLMWGVSGTVAPGLGGLGMTAWGPNGFVYILVSAVVAFLILAIIRARYARR